jgi:hypothetical protein
MTWSTDHSIRAGAVGTVPRIKRRSDSFRRTLSFAPNGLSQEEILQYDLPLAPCKRSTADTANYLAVICLGTSFDFDHLAVRDF